MLKSSFVKIFVKAKRIAEKKSIKIKFPNIITDNQKKSIDQYFNFFFKWYVICSNDVVIRVNKKPSLVLPQKMALT